MALPDLTGQNIENTYQRIVQTDGTNFYDGTGSVVNFGVDPFPYTGSAVITGSLNIIGQFTASGFNYPTIAGNEGEAIVINQDGNLQFAYPKAITERVKNVSGGPLLKGVPVHATGSGTSGNIVGVIAADAGVPAKMPATYVLNEDLANGAEGEALAVGYIQGVNTTGLIEGEVVYVAVGGGWTQTKPTGSALIQNLGVVTKVGTNGSGVVLGAGRSNDLPNIKAGSFWVGNANGVPTAVATSSFISVSQTSSFAKLNSDNTFTGENQFNNTTIFSSNIALAANINLENDLTYSLGGDSTRDYWFATASIGHIRTFENTIEFYDEITRLPKAALKIQDQNFILEKSDGTKTSMSGSSADFTGNVRAFSFFGNGSNLTGINTGSWNGIFTGSAEITGSLNIIGNLTSSGNILFDIPGGDGGIRIGKDWGNYQTINWISNNVGFTLGAGGSLIARVGATGPGGFIIGNVTNNSGTSATLDVRGDTVITGSNSSSGTYGLRVANSSGTNILSVENDGKVTIGPNSSTDMLTIDGNVRIRNGNRLEFRSTSNTYGVRHFLDGYQYKIGTDGSNGWAGLNISDNGGILLALSTGHSIRGVDNFIMGGKSFRSPHTGSFGFQTYGSTPDYVAIQANYTDNSNSGISFLTKTAGTDTERVRILATNGNVGIGTSTPSEKLHVIGKINLNDGNNNVLISTGNSTITASNTTAVGFEALKVLTTGTGNTALGYQAGLALTTAGGGTFVGYQAGLNRNRGNEVAVGYQALQNNGSGFYQTAIGYNAGQNGMGSYDIAIGWYAGAGAASGGFNIKIGETAGRFHTGTGCIIIGGSSLLTGTSSGVIAIGGGISAGSNTISIGHQSGNSNSTSSIFIGPQAGQNETGSNKLYIENSNSATPLIYGEFDTNLVRINGRFETSGSTIISGSLRGSVIDITPSNQTASLNCSLGNFFTLTLSSSVNIFLTASNIQAGQSINLRIIQPATSGSLSYGSEFKFPNGLPYTASATSSVTDILSFITFDSTTLYGSSLKNFI
jgi:hypothetical protein